MKLKLSLRMRVTLITGIMLVLICLILSGVIVRNAEVQIVDIAEAIPVEQVYVNASGGTEGIIRPTVPLTNFYNATTIAVVIVLVVGVIAVYFVTGISLKPVRRLQKEIASINERQLSKRIENFSAGDELASLAASFNQMLGRIESAFIREKRFTADAAHELKTPLAIIRTNLDVIKMMEAPDAADYRETVTVVQNQTERMSKLVDNLFSVYSMNGYQIDEIVYADKIAEEALSEQTEKAESRHIKINTSLTPCRVKANSVMLKHAVSNLIDNAIKYNEEGGCIALSVMENNRTCIITVQDTGIGISQAGAEHIFDPFYREDKSRSRQMGGAGLGLSIVKNIVEQHGGTVEYQPNAPKGSIFILKIPIVETQKRND